MRVLTPAAGDNELATYHRAPFLLPRERGCQSKRIQRLAVMLHCPLPPTTVSILLLSRGHPPCLYAIPRVTHLCTRGVLRAPRAPGGVACPSTCPTSNLLPICLLRLVTTPSKGLSPDPRPELGYTPSTLGVNACDPREIGHTSFPQKKKKNPPSSPPRSWRVRRPQYFSFLPVRSVTFSFCWLPSRRGSTPSFMNGFRIPFPFTASQKNPLGGSPRMTVHCLSNPPPPPRGNPPALLTGSAYSKRPSRFRLFNSPTSHSPLPTTQHKTHSKCTKKIFVGPISFLFPSFPSSQRASRSGSKGEAKTKGGGGVLVALSE
eukprot:Rhum_TRINITY_DN14847_c18_g1::Rhum_TRINITY_DN14847_c18_g1_i1::g.125774::m.125774